MILKKDPGFKQYFIFKKDRILNKTANLEIDFWIRLRNREPNFACWAEENLSHLSWRGRAQGPEGGVKGGGLHRDQDTRGVRHEMGVEVWSNRKVATRSDSRKS